MLADQRGFRIAELRGGGELDGVADHEDGLLHPVGPFDADQHVVRGNMFVVDKFIVEEARSGGKTRRGERLTGLDPRHDRSPVLDGRTDVRFEIVHPSLACGEGRVVDPSGSVDDGGESLKMSFSADLEHEPAVFGPEPMVDNRACPPSLSPIDQKFVTMSVIANTESNMATSTCWPSPVRSRCRRAARIPTVVKSAAEISPKAPTGDTLGGWSSIRFIS